jgi:hypothetical protein
VRVVVAFALLIGTACGPAADWKCTDNSGLNCNCSSPPAASDTATSCASYGCCVHYEDGSGLHCSCKQLSASTCSTSEVDARKAAGATNVYVVAGCPR